MYASKPTKEKFWDHIMSGRIENNFLRRKPWDWDGHDLGMTELSCSHHHQHRLIPELVQ